MKIIHDNLPQAITALRQCAREHEKECVPTFAIITKELCTDVVAFLENLLKCEVVNA